MTLEVEKMMVGGQVKKLTLDPKGFFIIIVDRKNGEIIVEHYENVQKNGEKTVSGKLAHVFAGTDAESLCGAIMSGAFVSRLDHAAYLGRELQKAENALKEGSEYVQDEVC